jgi:hypothetical protein
VNDRLKDELRTSAYWRDRAKEARAIADGLSDCAATQTMVQVTELYDRMADLAAKREDPTRKLPGSN